MDISNITDISFHLPILIGSNVLQLLDWTGSEESDHPGTSSSLYNHHQTPRYHTYDNDNGRKHLNCCIYLSISQMNQTPHQRRRAFPQSFTIFEMVKYDVWLVTRQ